jgi:hypothetical protein
VGPQASFSLRNVGVIGMALSSSFDRDIGEAGLAGELFYNYQNRNFDAGLIVTGFTKNYRNIQIETSDQRTEYEASFGIGYSSGYLGFLSLGFSTIKKYIGKDQRIWTASYSRILFRNTTLSATFRHTEQGESSNEFLISINYYLGHDISLFTHYEKNSERNATALQVQKNTPIGEGFGGKAGDRVT